jgi:hypothetical protein
MDAITRAIAKRTCHIIAMRFRLENERRARMSRLTEKLKTAGVVVGEVYKHAEEHADALIARKDLLKGKTTTTFEAHHAALNEAGKALDAFERDLAQVSNDPLGSSGDSPEVEGEHITTFPA